MTSMAVALQGQQQSVLMAALVMPHRQRPEQAQAHRCQRWLPPSGEAATWRAQRQRQRLQKCDEDPGLETRRTQTPEQAQDLASLALAQRHAGREEHKVSQWLLTVAKDGVIAAICNVAWCCLRALAAFAGDLASTKGAGRWRGQATARSSSRRPCACTASCRTSTTRAVIFRKRYCSQAELGEDTADAYFLWLTFEPDPLQFL